MHVNIEIADNSESLSRGLMFRKSMDKNSGMLFKFPDAIYASFWGKNTYIPLDVAFISSDGTTILDIHEIVPLSTRAVHSSYPCKYALEVNAGYFKENNIGVGEKITIDENEKKLLFGKNK